MTPYNIKVPDCVREISKQYYPDVIKMRIDTDKDFADAFNVYYESLNRSIMNNHLHRLLNAPPELWTAEIYKIIKQ